MHRPRHFISALLVAVLTAAFLVAPQVSPAVAASYVPTTGAIFQAPGAANIRTAIYRAIRYTPAGQRIRVATYSFTDTTLSDALIKAHKRGVRVQVVMAKATSTTSAAKSLKSALKSNFRAWAGGARKAQGNRGGPMHQKSWTFSSTGGKNYVSIVSSGNPTDMAKDHQYTDAWQFVDYKPVFNKLNQVFAQQFKGGVYPAPFRQFNLTPNTALTFGPWNTPSRASAAVGDPVLERINKLPNRHLTIRVAMAAWFGARGQAIARALVAKKKAGASVGVLYGHPIGPDVLSILAKGGIPRKDRYFSDNLYLHDKFMTAAWTTKGKQKYRVWLGSENWSSDVTSADELMVKIGNPAGYTAYVNWFNYLWSL